ncbi:MAG: hypothetical protein PHD55_09580 [Methanoregula sp.]|jgi:hypothetical protein|nr:hypothetical protein [Methanoregula sp.]
MVFSFSTLDVTKHRRNLILMFVGIVCFIVNIGLYYVQDGLGSIANTGVILIGCILFLWGGIAIAKDFRTTQTIEKE